MKHDPENRASVLPKLLECLRTGSLPERFLELQMTQEPLLRGALGIKAGQLKGGINETTDGQNPEKQRLSLKDWTSRK